jgi:FAD/FMN-containing dehydrogenase
LEQDRFSIMQPPLSATLADAIAARLGPLGVIRDEVGMAPYEASARHGKGHACAVVRPATIEELCWVVERLLAANAPFVVQGAGTGLVAGATPSSGGTQWVLSLQRLRQRLDIDARNRTVTVSAGYRLSDLNRAAAEHGLFFPIDLGADPTIGGMVATNTGGARLVRYGGVRENLLDVRAVLARAPVATVGGRQALRKNNTGLGWSQVLCGTFGAFGIVAEATLELHPIPRQTATALVATDSAAAAIDLLLSLERELGDFVSAFEGISGRALSAVLRHGLPSPFPQVPAYSVLLELATALPAGSGVDLEALLTDWLARELEGDLVRDAVVGKPEQLWRIRHGISEAVQGLGRLLAFDVAVSRSTFAEFREQAVRVVQETVPGAQVHDFGHLGDGGVHLNVIVPPEAAADRIDALRDAVYALTVCSFGGSFSAEHGIGPSNRRWYAQYTEPARLELAAALHHHFDPARRLGNVHLDKVLP